LGCRAPSRRPSRAHALHDWPARMHARQGACPPRMCTSCRRVSASSVVLTYRGAHSSRTHPWVHAMLHAVRTVRVQPLPASVDTFHRTAWSTTARPTDPSCPLRRTVPPRLCNGFRVLHWYAIYWRGAYLREGCAWRMSQARSTYDDSTLSLFIKPFTSWTLTCLRRLFSFCFCRACGMLCLLCCSFCCMFSPCQCVFHHCAIPMLPPPVEVATCLLGALPFTPPPWSLDKVLPQRLSFDVLFSIFRG